MKHLFASHDYPPVGGGMARRYVELCRRFAHDEIVVSTTAAKGAREFDEAEGYEIDRQPFGFSDAKLFVNQMRWGGWLRRRCTGNVDLLHCGNIRPVGYAVWWAHARTGIPYLLYVNGHDLLKDLALVRRSTLRKRTARAIVGDACGIVATSAWTVELTTELVREAGIRRPPPIAEIPLGADPQHFSPSRDTGRVRKRLGLGTSPLLVTVARLVPHKGQDIAIRALASLQAEFPSLMYLLVGEGPDRDRLTALAHELGVGKAVVFAGRLHDDEVAEAYATATIYVGPSRVDRHLDAEGFGISFVEASASGVPVVAGRTAGVSSAVIDGVTGLLVSPDDPAPVADAIGTLLRDPSLRARMAREGRRVVETRLNWDRVSVETQEFAASVLRRARAS